MGYEVGVCGMVDKVGWRWGWGAMVGVVVGWKMGCGAVEVVVYSGLWWRVYGAGVDY